VALELELQLWHRSVLVNTSAKTSSNACASTSASELKSNLPLALPHRTDVVPFGWCVCVWCLEARQVLRDVLVELQLTHFVVSSIQARKGRYCKMQPAKGQAYCGSHASNGVRVRVPCPLDPGHTVYADQLKKHLKICNAYRRQQATADLPYYVHGINAGPTASASISREEASRRVQALVRAWHDAWHGSKHHASTPRVHLSHPCFSISLLVRVIDARCDSQYG